MEIKERDFANLLFPVMEKGAGSLLKRIPQLSQMPSFSLFSNLSIEINTVIKYVVLTYDRRSPVVEAYRTDHVKRKIVAAEYAGWKADPITGEFPKEIDKIMKCGNKEVNRMIVDYIRLFNDPEWAYLSGTQEALYQKIEAMISLGRGKDERDTAAIEKIKGDLEEQIDKMTERMSRKAAKILLDENPYLRRDLFCTIDAETRNRLDITPERMAGIDA